MRPRPLYLISREARADMKAQCKIGKRVEVRFSRCWPDLHAMRWVTTVDDTLDKHLGRALAERFLGRAVTWHGPVARRLKRELKDIIDHGRP